MKIRNVKDVAQLLDRRAGSALGRPLSILRTLIWVVVGAYVIGLLLPAPKVVLAKNYYNHRLTHLRARDLVLDKNDPRGWQHLKRNPHRFTIAWIGGSTIQKVDPKHPGFVPVDVMRRLPHIDGKPVQINMYLMEASRTFDLFAATADALKTKPDLVVLDLNPIWLFNPNDIQSWTNFNPAAFPSLVTDPGNWPLLSALYSPSDVALSLASGHLASIRDRWSYAKKLREAIDKMTPLTEPPPPAPGGPKPTGLEYIATMQEAQNFWNYYRNLPRNIPSPKRYPAALMQAATDGSSLNDMIVSQMLDMMGDSKIPALAYVSAVDPSTLTDPAVDAALHRIEDHLHAIADDNAARTLLVQWRSGTRLVRGLKFRDMAHMIDDEPMVNELTETICSHLAEIDSSTVCTPKPRKASP